MAVRGYIGAGVTSGLSVAWMLAVAPTTGRAQSTYNPTTTNSYNVANNFTPTGVPNGAGVAVTFAAATATDTISLNAAITLATLSFTNNTTSSLITLANGTGSLTLDNGANEAAITLNGTSVTTNALTISASTTLNSTLRFTNNDTSGTGAATATITGSLAGSGGLIKDGPGRLSFSTAAKAYTGATLVNQGRLRYTGSGQSTGTSAITVNSGGSLYLDQATGTFSFGGGTALITINGDGDNGGGSGTQGAIRNQGSGTTTLANAVALGSDATIHVDGGSGVLQLNGGISGAFTLLKSGGGTLNFTTANGNYTGGTNVTNGTVLVAAASNLGSGALAFAQTTGNNAAVTLNNATQSVSSLSSAFVDTTGTQTQTLTLNGTALTINQTTNTTFGVGAVSTLTSVVGGTGSVAKSGNGTLSLTGANTYGGGTTITGGKLLVANGTGSATGAGTVGIGASGTLASGAGAVGFVTGNVITAGTTSTIAPGATATANTGTVGALTLSGGLDLTNGATIPFDLSSTGSDLIRVSGGTLLGSTVAGGITFNFATTETSGTYTLINFTGASTTSLDTTDFTATGVTGNFTVTGTEVDFTIVPVPEPTTVLGGFLLVSLASWHQRRRLRTAWVGLRRSRCTA